MNLLIGNRLVLDTNVCLDLFVFRDERSKQLYSALQTGMIEAVTREDCRMEWLLVLRYPRFALSAEQIKACVGEFDSLITCPPLPLRTSCDESSALPRCSDVDDQKFLETAHDCRATSLITKDKALLKLAGKCRRAGLFQILQPSAWRLESQRVEP